MQDKQLTSIYQKSQQTLSPRDLYLLAEIKQQLQTIGYSLPQSTKEFIMLIPSLRKEAIQSIAQQFATAIENHLLGIIAMFYQRAEQEGIRREERDETIQDVEVEARFFMGLTRKIAVHTLEALARLGEITLSILDLGQCKNAEEAQSWLYDLPVVYQESLERERLV